MAEEAHAQVIDRVRSYFKIIHQLQITQKYGNSELYLKEIEDFI